MTSSNRLRLYAIAIAGCSFCFEGSIADAAQADGDELVAAITANHDRLLHHPAGLRITYHLEVSQDRRRPYFLWDTGSRGEIKLRWPKLYNHLRGLNVEDHASVVEREGEYNMETRLAVGRDSQFVQIAPYRQAWSAVHLFPLMFQFFAESDQKFVPGQRYHSDYWLPAALGDSRYGREADESVDGIPCQVWSKANGCDKLWVAAGHGAVVCRREVRDPASRTVIERTVARKLGQFGPDLWFPRELVQEKYNPPADNTLPVDIPTHVVKVLVDKIASGVADDQGLHVQIPVGAMVDDQLQGVSYRKSTPDSGFHESLKQARYLLQHRPLEPSPQTLTYGLAASGAVLFLLNLILFARSFRRRAGTTR